MFRFFAALTFVFTIPFAAPERPPLDDTIPFESLGRELLALADSKRGANPGEAPATADGTTKLLFRLQPAFHRIPLGAVELWELKNNFGDLSKGEGGSPQPLAALQSHANLCLQIQKLWIDRADFNDVTRILTKKHLGIAENWVKSWKADGPTRLKLEEEEALLQIAQAFKAVKKDEKLEIGKLPVLFILNTRRQYISLLGASGIIDTTQQSILWDAKARTWVLGGVNYRCNAVTGSWGPPEGKTSPLVDNPMPNADANQYITHQIAHYLIDLTIPEAPPWASEGLAICDTVIVAKADETRCTGNIAAARVADVGGFMPGQKEDFRWMPMAPAEKSPYRRGPSAHFFTKELRRARAKDSMKVVDYDSGKLINISPPILKPVEKIPDIINGGSAPLKASYSEFFRAYVAGFAHYFFTEAKIDKTTILPKLVRELNQMRAAGAMPADAFHTAVKKITNKSLGTAADAKQDWEGAYLEWIDSQG